MVKAMFVDPRERQKRQGQRCKANNAKKTLLIAF
jgi:hypothetical protein